MTSEVKIKAGQPQVQKAPAESEKKEMTVAFIGNPNCGKTTLFNAYTGANLKVANWPGVTVEKVEGAINAHGYHIHLVDLPGTYSLTSYTMEEQVSRNFILSDDVDVIVDVIDASALERNLYLTLQLLELGKPVVVALNMMDIVEKRGHGNRLAPPAGNARRAGHPRIGPEAPRSERPAPCGRAPQGPCPSGPAHP